METVIPMKNNQLKHTTINDPRKGATFITGATGLIGSHIAGDLLKKRQKIIVLIRRKGTLNAEQRFHSICNFMDLGSLDLSHVRIVEGSLDKRYFGVDRSDYNELCGETGRIIHCAGNTTFSEKMREESERDNITGLKNVLDFTRDSACSWFHLISTIYTVGMKSGICEEELNESGLFTNFYEEIKCRGERSTLEYCRENGISATIIRPSIVVGNSLNGRTFRFNGLYYPIKALILMRDMFYHDLVAGKGTRANKMSISIKDEKVNLPLRLEHNTKEGINLIPIDFMVDAVHSIINQPKNGSIYHVAAKKNVTIAELIDFTQKYFNITGLHPVGTDFFLKHSKTPLESLFDKYIEPYLPYMKDSRKFSTKNTDAVINSYGITSPTFDYKLFSRCMKFAVKKNWGKAQYSNNMPKRLVNF
ncbi:SDR family oxidoreductase [Candidatus Latescibacterota bacterium]